MTRKALGRGLSALIREVEAMPAVAAEASPATVATVGPADASFAGAAPQHVLTALIDPNPFQPRRTFREGALKELARSIACTGLLQPVLLRPTGERYQLVAGERRWRAALQAELRTLPAIVRPMSDQDALELALTENLLREDLNALEAAEAYSVLQSRFGLTHEQIADRLKLNRVTVTNTLRLLRLPEEVRHMLATEEISAGHARALLALDSAASQAKFAAITKDKALSVRQLESLIAGRPTPGAKTGRAAPQTDPNIRAAARELERVLGTRVKITGNGRRGKVEIKYFSKDDLNRIFELITHR